MKKIFNFIFAILIAGVFLSFQNQNTVAHQVDGCANLLLNGDMENNAGWRLTSGSLPSQYVPTAFTGSRGLLVGPPEGNAANRETFSTAWQAVRLPAEVTTLSFWYRPQSGPEAGADQQYAGLIGQDGEIVTLFLNVLEASDEWVPITADVSDYAGQTLWVYFGVLNDGKGDVTRMFVDEVILCVATDAVIPPQPATPVPTLSALSAPPSFSSDDVYTFEEIGFVETTLHGPFDSASYRLGLPANWELVEGVAIQLHLTVLGTATGLPQTTVPSISTLNVFFNDVHITTKVLQVGGGQTLVLDIPIAAVAERSPGGRHELELVLDSSESCDVDNDTMLLVHADSTLVLPYVNTTPNIDLRLFPRPLFQDSFLPETAVLVVPDQPTATELRAAFTVAAGLGQLSNSHMSVSLVPVRQLTPDVRKSFPLVFVGLPENLPVLNEVTWPAALANGQFGVAEAQSGDGFLQMTVSPWNEGMVVMLVSSSSDEGLVKAAQAVSQGNIRVAQRSDLAIVTAVDPFFIPNNPTIADKSLADLGYVDQELSGRGRRSARYEFNVPAGYVVGDEAYIELAFSSSTLLNYEQSGLVVRLNDRAIGSARFEDSTDNPKRIRIALPRSVIHTGVNHLTVRAELIPFSECIHPSFDGIWLTLWADSRISLPLLPVSNGIRPTLDLSDFPVPFDNEPTLRDVALVVPANDPIAWDTAAKIASSLGDKSNSPVVLFTVEFADQVSTELQESYHLIVVGLPNDLPILADLQTAMPAPFTLGSNFC